LTRASLRNIEHKKEREITDVLYAVYPQGENTLTVRNEAPVTAPRAPPCKAPR